jgi:uncharacterized membrane protein YfcA
MSMLLVLPLALVSGLLIGCVGIGGVLLVPSLTLGGIPVHVAIAASMFSYLFAGGIATWIYAREGSIAWGSAGWLAAGAMPGAFAGAVVANAVGAEVLTAVIGIAVAFSGLRSLWRAKASESGRGHELGPLWLGTIGLGVGFGSALTGTGGPTLLVPLLIWLGLPVLAVVGLSQAIQVPIAAMATVGNLAYGHLDIELGLVLSFGVLAGSAAGARIAHALPRLALTRLVGIVLLLVGGLLFYRARQLLLPSL